MPGARAIFEAVKRVDDFRNTRVAHQEKPLTNPDETKAALLKWVETLALLWQENADTIYARKCVVTLAGVTPKAQAAVDSRQKSARFFLKYNLALPENFRRSMPIGYKANWCG